MGGSTSMRKIKFLWVGWMLCAGLVSYAGAGELEDYALNINAGYQNFLKGNFSAALSLYKKTSNIAKKMSAEYQLDADAGIQNCLLALKNYEETLDWGQSILRKYPTNLYVLANTAYASFSLGKYSKAAKLYKKMLAVDPKNKAALEGLAWTYYYSGDFDEAKKFADQAVLLGSNDSGLKNLKPYSSVPKNIYEYSGYLTYVGYGSPSKRDALGRNGLFTYKRNLKHRFDLLYGALTLNYVSPTLIKYQEDDYTGSYSYTGPYSATLSYKKIRSNDNSLGEGNIGFVSLEKWGVSASGSYSKYMTSRASEVGLGYRLNLNRFSLSCAANAIFRDAILNDGVAPASIKNIVIYKNFLVAVVGTDYYFDYFHVNAGAILGKHSLHVGEYGFAANNSPDELYTVVKGGIEFYNRYIALGYSASYGEGIHYASADLDEFSMVSHSAKLSIRFY